MKTNYYWLPADSHCEVLHKNDSEQEVATTIAKTDTSEQAHSIAKAMNIMGSCSCLQNLKEGEPFFVLRGQDVSAPNVVMEWINININTAPVEKLQEAFDLVLAMRAHQDKKIAD